jgi:hypothetical protein
MGPTVWLQRQVVYGGIRGQQDAALFVTPVEKPSAQKAEWESISKLDLDESNVEKHQKQGRYIKCVKDFKALSTSGTKGKPKDLKGTFARTKETTSWPELRVHQDPT